MIALLGRQYSNYFTQINQFNPQRHYYSYPDFTDKKLSHRYIKQVAHCHWGD